MTPRGHMQDGEPRHELPLWRRLVWFVGLWVAGVLVVGTVAFVIRLALRA